MKKSELKDYVKEQIVDVLSTEAQDDRIGNPKFGPAPMEFQTMRDTLGDKKMLDRIQMLNVNDLEELLNALTFVVQKEASEEDIENQKAYNDELEKTNDLMSKMKMEDEEAPAGDKEVQVKASKQDKIIKDFKRIEAQMKTHLELFKTSESPKNKEIAKQMLKKLTPEYQAAKKAYDKLKNVKV